MEEVSKKILKIAEMLKKKRKISRFLFFPSELTSTNRHFFLKLITLCEINIMFLGFKKNFRRHVTGQTKLNSQRVISLPSLTYWLYHL